jgi:hypothetical protein
MCLRRRSVRVFGIALILAIAWTAWWVWPPRPQLRLLIEPAVACPLGAVTADGRSLFCDVEPPKNFLSGVVMPPRRIEVFELPSGTRRLTLDGRYGLLLSFSPDGSRLVESHPGEFECRLRALPSGKLIGTVPHGKSNSLIQWSIDSRFFMTLGPGLTAYGADDAALAGRYDVTDDEFYCAMRMNRSGFVALMSDRWALLVHSFDHPETDVFVPLPGFPVPEWRDGKRRVVDGSISIAKLASTNDGSVVFALLDRHHADGEKDRCRRFLARWERVTRKWTEVDQGPITQSHTAWDDGLSLSADDRYLSTTGEHLAWYHGQPGENDPWGEEEAKQFCDRNLWDATTLTPRCLNDDGLPTGSYSFDPTGRRFLQGNQVLYDADTRARLKSPDIEIERISHQHFSADGRWLALSEKRVPWRPTWLPSRLIDWINRWTGPADQTVHVIRLEDGKAVRKLSGRTSPTLTTDGYLWTVTEADRNNDTATLFAERWSPEAPGPPWWLILITAVGLLAMLRAGRKPAPSA